jgi:hypothetical protein
MNETKILDHPAPHTDAATMRRERDRVSIREHQSIKCKNCGHMATHKYCAHCGQPTRVRRLNFEDFLEDGINETFHLSQRYFVTLREMHFRPGPTISAYLAGKRRTYQNPLSYFAVGYLALGLFSKYVFHQAADLPVGAIGNLTQYGVLAGTAVIALVAHYVAAQSVFVGMETFAVFLFVYGTMFVDAVLVMALEVPFRKQLLTVTPRVGGMIIDVPMIVVLCIYFAMIVRYKKIPTTKLLLALVFGVGFYVVIRQGLGIK